ncbi:Trp biosynthesis-associated membrane protein [Glutamicibacter endophyticus]|uniref:Trp biosynthesis-associated membrane protein n=1 Tax=Glutamicibacter endophyticus TaxID=1522174 RepID=UPI003AF1295A
MSRLVTRRNATLLGLLGALLGMFTATRTWVSVTVQSSTVQVPQIAVTGSEAAPSVTALCVVVLAGSLALLIAGKLVRWVILAISALAGLGVIIAGAGALADPVGAASGRVGEATGLSTVTADYQLSAIPALAIVAGALILLYCVLALLAGSRSTASKRFNRQPSTTTGPAAPGSAAPADRQSRRIDDWERLSRGEDPTD